ncbi:MAG: 50S ribosomal protein L15 [Candidatus Moranbacteria bacterium]|nr:50S ribosomal protein L15 [Candidatus Moranbacteria bacterium]
MQIHQISRPDWLKKIKRIGRGGKRGTYSGKGNKGQKSRSGGNIPPGFEGQDTTLVARSPKIKGFTSPNRPNVTLGLSLLEKHFKAGEVVSPVSLTKKKLIKLNKKSRLRRIARVKILGTGKIAKALTIENCLISKGAKAAIEKAGGKVFNSEKNKEQRTEGK